MENVESIWQVGIIALLAGGLIGALAYRLLAPSLTKAEQVRSDLEAARQELIDYKASVNSHFDKTSELVNDLTQNYVKVYQHLAEGAQTLGDSRQLNNLLEQQQGKVLLTVGDESESPQQAVDDSGVEFAAASDSDGESAERTGEPLAAADRGEAVAGKDAQEAGDTRSPQAESDQAGERKSAQAAGGTATPGASDGEPEVEKTVQPTGETAASETPAESDDATDSGEPRLNVDKIKSVGVSATEASVETGRVGGRADEIGDEAAPTRH